MKGITAGFLVGILFSLIASLFFTYQHALLIGAISLLVTIWTNNALPLGVVSLLPLILFPSLGILEVSAVAPNYSKTIIFLFIGGFMMAIAVEKIGLHKYLSKKLLSIFPHSARGIIYALSFTSALLSGLLSNTTITLMLMPVALFLTQNTKLKIRFLLAIAYGASIGGTLTPIGTAPNLILLGFLETHGLETIAFGKWILMIAPAAFIMLLIVPYILAHSVKDECVAEIDKSVSTLDQTQKRLLWILGSLALLLLLNTPIKPYYSGLGLDEKMVLLGYGLLMFLPKYGFLDWEDTRNLPYEIIFLFGAGFSIATAVSTTGLAADIAQKLSFISTMPLFWMFVIVGTFVIFSTEITSNTALTSLALPIFYEFAKQLSHADGVALMLVATIAASFAFMLPIATPPNAIVMSSRIIPVKTMAKIGVILNLLGIIVISIVGYLFWR